MASTETVSDATRNRIKENEPAYQEVTELMEAGFRQRIFSAAMNPDATTELAGLREQWGTSPEWPITTVFTVGVYNLMHLQHRGFLLHTKMQGAPRHFERHYAETAGVGWEDLDEETRVAWAREFVLSGEIKQIVSVDGNTNVAVRKGFAPEKGNTARPILDWETRARDVASAFVEGPDGSVPIADAVTVHDPYEFPETPNEHWESLAELLRPDVWAVYCESEDIQSATADDPRFRAVEFRLIGPEQYYSDALIGTFHTTHILNRVRET